MGKLIFFGEKALQSGGPKRRLERIDESRLSEASQAKLRQWAAADASPKDAPGVVAPRFMPGDAA
jgi:hypothetical protein